MRYVIDIDGTLCFNGKPENYAEAIPQVETIKNINHLYNLNHEIVLWTARLEEDRAVTEKWLSENNVKYNELHFGKIGGDVYIDDKASKFLPNLEAKLNRYPLVICWSGGMDSFTAYHYAIKKLSYKPEDILLLNFDINHPYRIKEKYAMERIGLPYITLPVPLCDDRFGNMPDINNYIIPGRNMVFAAIAATLGDRVWICGSKFEDHPLMFDKNSGFYRTMSMAASQATGATTIVETPFYEETKTDMVNWNKAWNTLEGMDHTVSCYHPEEKRCGQCGLCFKRAIAVRAAGLDEEYTVEPFESDIAKDFILKYEEALEKKDFSHYSEERIMETLNVVNEWRNKK